MKNYSRKIGNRKGLVTFRTPSTFRIRRHLAVVGAKSKHDFGGSKKFHASPPFNRPLIETDKEKSAEVEQPKNQQSSSTTKNDKR